jgi:hypothetical protein
VTVDDDRIDEIRRAVLDRLHRAASGHAPAGLEARVAALEAAVAALSRGGHAPAASTAPAPHRARTHPSLVVVALPPEADACAAEPGRCLLEPDKPCTQSHACRTFGH